MKAVPGQTRPGTRCRRPSCRQQYAAHVGGACPDLPGLTFQARKHIGASQSFAPAEVEALDAVCKAVLSGKYETARAVLRTSAGNGVMRKVLVMKKSLARIA